MRHPDEEQLLRYADGELPSRAAGEVRSHLEACWQCRAQLEELHETVTQCVGYRKNVLQRHLPQPPAPWVDIYRRFDEIDIAFAQPSLLTRIARVFEWPVHNTKKWAPVAVALLVVFLLLYRYRVTPSVQAAELLRKAIVAADTRPVKPHRIQIRTQAHQFTRVTGTERKLTADSSELNSLQAMFVAAKYDWDDPLSAKSFQAWRDQLPAKQDRVIEEQDAYRIRTDAASGELKEATLKLRTPDLQPVEGRFEFRNRDWVEITALADEVLSPIAASPETHAGVPAVSPNSPAPIANAPEATIGDELRVMAALHGVGADLGDPVEVSRTGSEILVTGAGIAPQRQQEIQSALNAQAHVTVRFSESAPARVRPEGASPDSQPGADLRQLQSRVAEQVGGRANFEQLASQVLDLSEPMMARAYALRRLAERFPAGAESQMSAQDRQLLRQLQREHTAALRQRVAEIDRVLKPVLASMRGAGNAAPGGALSSNAWQPATEELFQSARRVEKLLAVMFGAATAESAEDQLPVQLLSSLAQLRAKVEGYERLSANMER